MQIASRGWDRPLLCRHCIRNHCTDRQVHLHQAMPLLRLMLLSRPNQRVFHRLLRRVVQSGRVLARDAPKRPRRMCWLTDTLRRMVRMVGERYRGTDTLDRVGVLSLSTRRLFCKNKSRDSLNRLIKEVHPSGRVLVRDERSRSPRMPCPTPFTPVHTQLARLNHVDRCPACTLLTRCCARLMRTPETMSSPMRRRCCRSKFHET
jgi:hypothetical protein